VRNGLVVRLVLLVLLGGAGSAAAQEPKGYVQWIVGSARTIESDSAYAGLGAWRLRGRWHLFGEIGRLRNAIGEELDARARAIADEIRATHVVIFQNEFPVDFDVRVPTWYGFGGLRAAGPGRGRIGTYLEGGAGSARLDPQAHLTINGDRLDEEGNALLGLGDNRQDRAFLAGGGAGASVRVWKRIRVEGGYRFMRLFGGAKTNIHQFRFGGGWTF
jgi:hypothetical protein